MVESCLEKLICLFKAHHREWMNDVWRTKLLLLLMWEEEFVFLCQSAPFLASISVIFMLVYSYLLFGDILHLLFPEKSLLAFWTTLRCFRLLGWFGGFGVKFLIQIVIFEPQIFVFNFEWLKVGVFSSKASILLI